MCHRTVCAWPEPAPLRFFVWMNPASTLLPHCQSYKINSGYESQAEILTINPSGPVHRYTCSFLFSSLHECKWRFWPCNYNWVNSTVTNEQPEHASLLWQLDKDIHTKPAALILSTWQANAVPHIQKRPAETDGITSTTSEDPLSHSNWCSTAEAQRWLCRCGAPLHTPEQPS